MMMAKLTPSAELEKILNMPVRTPRMIPYIYLPLEVMGLVT